MEDKFHRRMIGTKAMLLLRHARLPFLVQQGVDAVWLFAFYRWPQADAGYNVADYRGVDPLFGSLQYFDRLLQLAHAAACA